MPFTPNPNLIRELADSAEIKAAADHAAEKIADAAREIAPMGTVDDDHPGQFRDSIHAEGAAIVSDDPAAAYIIFGTSRTPPHDTFRRAAEISGYRVTK